MRNAYHIAIGLIVMKLFDLSWWSIATYVFITGLLELTPIGEELELIGWRIRWHLEGRTKGNDE